MSEELSEDDIEIGKEISLPYPMTRYKFNVNFGGLESEYWRVGVFKECDEYYTYYTCTKEGKIHITALSVAEMPDRYMNRVVYSIRFTDPDGERIGANKTIHLATVNKFLKMISGENGYFSDYEIDGIIHQDKTFNETIRGLDNEQSRND